MNDEVRYWFVMCLMFKLSYYDDIEQAVLWFFEPVFDEATVTPLQRIARGEGIKLFEWLTGEGWS